MGSSRNRKHDVSLFSMIVADGEMGSSRNSPPVSLVAA